MNSHQGNIYGHLGGGPGQTKIIEATYPGAVHKSANYAGYNHAGYIGADYAHGAAINHVPSVSSYIHAPPVVAAAPSVIPYNHGPVPIAAPAHIPYNHGPIPIAGPIVPVGTYSHSRYAVSEGPGTYAAHSRYSIAPGPYSHGRYPIAPIANGIYPHSLPVNPKIPKIAYTPAIAHMGYPSHPSQNYAW